jgi:hydroxymethylpyrimidine/phosphomethylpyrimidine kinase
MSMRHAVPIALTIAGSDPSGGAGLQADLKTFHQHGVYGASVVTLLTVQSTQRVSRVDVLEADLVREQLDAVLADFTPQAIKTGALGSSAVVRAVAECLLERLRGDASARTVLDPVMVSKHGHFLLQPDAIDACIEDLFPLASLLTPNVPEAEQLLSLSPGDRARIETEADAHEAALVLARRLGVPVLLKGGHLGGSDRETSTDVLAIGGRIERFSGPRIQTTHTHGTGCTYSAAIAARLARGQALTEAIAGAKAWLTRAIAHAPAVGRGIGPVDHLEPLEAPDLTSRA